MLEALACAIDGTDEVETMRLAAEFNSSFGNLVRASISTESVAAQEDFALLGSFGPPAPRQEAAPQNALSANIVAGGQEAIPRELEGRDTHEAQAGEDPRSHRTGKTPKKATLKADDSVDEVEEPKARKNKKERASSSEDSEIPKPKKKKLKKKVSKKKKPSKSSSPSSSESSDQESETSLSSSDSSEDSDDEENAELCYDITEFDSADLPDLPDKWDKGFKTLRSYVPLTLFKISLLEAYYDDEKEQKIKDKADWSKSSLKNLEKQLTYGDFIEMCDLEERYAREIYGLDTYADYVVQHKKIVSDLKKSYNCWMIGLRYHLKVRTVIFRRRKLIKSKIKGKSVLKDKVKIPNGLQPGIERQARHDADRAGDLQFVDNPYAVGGPKFGHNFATGRQQVVAGAPATVDRSGDGFQTPGYRGKRGNGYKKPFVKKNVYPPYNRYARQHGEGQAGKCSQKTSFQYRA